MKKSRPRKRISSIFLNPVIVATLFTGVVTLLVAIINVLPFIQFPSPPAQKTQTPTLTTVLPPSPTSTPTRIPVLSTTPAPALVDPKDISQQVVSLRNDISLLQLKINEVEKLTKASRNDFDTIKIEIKNIDTRLQVIEDAISEDPANVLQLAKLKSDVDNVNNQIDALKSELESTRSETQRTSNLFFTVFGLIFAVLGVITTFALNLRTKSIQEQAEAAIIRDDVNSLSDQLVSIVEARAGELATIAELRGQLTQINAQFENLMRQSAIERANIELRDQVATLNERLENLSNPSAKEEKRD